MFKIINLVSKSFLRRFFFFPFSLSVMAERGELHPSGRKGGKGPLPGECFSASLEEMPVCHYFLCVRVVFLAMRSQQPVGVQYLCYWNSSRVVGAAYENRL